MIDSKKPIVTIDIDDVRAAGSVAGAVEAACRRTDGVASGVVGMAFATSGPGPGWSRRYGVEEWSMEAFRGGALAYVDAGDGRVIWSEPVEEGDEDSETSYDMAGDAYTVGEWSEGSEVRVECPDADDAMAHPQEAASMAEAVIDYHGPMSDRKGWAELVRRIEAAAEAFDSIDPDDLSD